LLINLSQDGVDSARGAFPSLFCTAAKSTLAKTEHACDAGRLLCPAAAFRVD
jgi:hypothetical protein